MFCTTCGNETPGEARFCGHCGAPTAPPASRKLAFHGDGLNLLGIYIINTLLAMCTLGIYYFWGKVRLRQYLYGQTEFDGDRFAFHGTGREMLIGWLKVFGFFVVAVTFIVCARLIWPHPATETVAAIIVYIAVLCVTPYALVGSRRYRLSRSSWRGIRFSFRGRAGNFFGPFVGGVLATLFSLGLYAPFFGNTIRDFFTNHSYFGSQRFSYDGKGKDLFGSWLVALLLLIPTLGISFFFFSARQTRYFWERTGFGTLRFESTVTGGKLLGLSFTNLLLVIFTLGLGLPWATVRTIRFNYDNLIVHGTIDMAVVRQELQMATATGEGLADILDLDGGLGV